MNKLRHPMQPMHINEYGIVRFKPNKIIQELLTGTAPLIDLNELRRRFNGKEFQEDHEQIAQLIGYSVSGFCDLSIVSDRAAHKASKKSNKLNESTKS